MSEHTPGPWEVTHFVSLYDRAEYRIRGGKLRYVALTPGDDVEDEANARLIAAAPELLEALLKPFPTGAYMRWLRDGDPKSASEIDAWNDSRRAAIAKAKGEKP